MARKKSGSGLKVDFSGVEDGGAVRVPEDDYKVRVKNCKQDIAESSGNTMLVWDLEILEGKYKGKVIRDRTVLTPKALFRLRNLLQAMGINVPKKVVNLPAARKFIGRELGITVVDGEPYEGRIKSEVGDYIDLETLASADPEDEEDEDEDDLEDEEEEDEDEDEEEDEEDEELDELDLDDL